MQATATLSKLFNQLILLLAVLIIELLIRLHNLRSYSHPITTQRYLKFIEDKNPTICYTKRLNHIVECTICLSEFKEGQKVRNLKCKHTFHKDCLDKWLQQYWATCPLCRKKLLPDHVVSKHRQHLQIQVDPNENDERIPLLLSALRDTNTFHGLF